MKKKLLAATFAVLTMFAFIPAASAVPEALGIGGQQIPSRLVIQPAVSRGVSALYHCNDWHRVGSPHERSSRIPALKGAYRLSLNCWLERGDENLGVTELQYSLKMCNGQGIGIDGVYGPATENAVRTIQRKGGLARDGVYGPYTGDKMLWKTYNGSCRQFTISSFN